MDFNKNSHLFEPFISILGGKNVLLLTVKQIKKPYSMLHIILTDNIRPEFFYFSCYRPSRPNFLEIEKKIKEIFFSILFFYFPPTHTSTVLESSYVFSFCLFYCCQVD